MTAKRTRKTNIKPYEETPVPRVSVKIYGQPRTGTNLVEHVLRELGCDVRRNVGGWKHGAAALCADRVVVVSKNPYAWAASVKTYEPEPGMPEWGIDGWVRRENAYFAFAAANPDRVLVVAYGDLMDGWDSEVARIAGFVGAPDGAASVAMPATAMDKSGTPGLQPFDANYYRRHLYMDELSPREVRGIRAALDGRAAEAYGGPPPVAQPAATPDIDALDAQWDTPAPRIRPDRDAEGAE